MTDAPIETEVVIIPMLDPESGERLDTQVAAEFEVDDQKYYVVTPVDELISVIRIVGEGDDEALEELETEEFEPVSKIINEAVGQWGLKVAVKANELVLVGEIPEDLYEDCEEIEVETDDGDERSLLILVEVDTGDTTYLVAANGGYILYPAIDCGDHCRPLNPEEVGAMREIFDEVYRVMDGDGDDGEE